ncbi:MAG: cell wall metabolism sensor histidine kinase WalK [Eubacteriales bacterium]|nr:cell wall metabolism sensor histidine kinase WalK [Eubacteriales bacterium]
MRSVFYWRILIVSIIALLLANIVLLAAYTYVGKNTYISIEMANLEPEAEVTRQIYEEYKNGYMNEEAFQRLIEKQTVSSESAILIADALGKILIVRNVGSTVEVQDFGEYYRAEVQNVLRGQTVENKNLLLLNGETAVSVGIPVRDTDGNVTGVILVIKQIKRIQSAFNQLNNVLTGTILAILPVVMLLVAFSTNRLSKPLHDMSNAAIEMSKGRFNVRANEKASGEIGILARALNTLCDNLSQTIYQLQSEKRQLNQILSSFTDGVAAIDNIGCLTHYNPALMKMFGAVEVKVPMDLVPDASIWEMFRSVYESREPASLHYSLPNERVLWITIVPVTDEEGECTGVVGLFKDMTDLERLEKTRRDYVANVSHELRTPLTAVRGLLEPLSDGMVQDEETKQRYYRIMLREVIRLSRLITDMLELSRLQSGTEHMELHAVNLEELLADTKQNYQNEAAQRGIRLVLDAKNVPYAMTDEDRVEQLLVILLDNAMHYTPEGGSITISASETTGDRILVTVADTGCGISNEDLPQIFERFYKTDKSRREGGTGLGLSIAKQIIDKLGESIFVESEMDKGTSFHFTLKKYVSNAIALGPSSANTVIHDMEEKPAHTQQSDRASQDAPYEVISKAAHDRKPKKRN